MENLEALHKSRQDPILDFLALFNQIDKHFDKILKLEKFLPYNEKMKRVIDGNYPISWFIKLHQYQLRYFGEIRNQITHGIKLDGHTYILPTPHALTQLGKYATSIKKPPKAIDIFNKKVYTCTVDTELPLLIKNIKTHNYSHIPVYSQDDTFMGVITEDILFFRLAENFNKHKQLNGIKVGQLPLERNEHGYMFVGKRTNIYEIDKIFTIRKQKKKRLGAIFLTQSGHEHEKIFGIITAGDTALIDTYIIH